MGPKHFSIRGRARSFGFAFAGLKYVFVTQHNFWIHLCISVVVVVLGLILHISINDWRWLITAMALVLVTETLNTAIEKACDAFVIEFNPNIEKAKDIAAGAVLITAIAAALIGATVFFPYLFRA
jgi:diacylglycerol kinase (ATP)